MSAPQRKSRPAEATAEAAGRHENGTVPDYGQADGKASAEPAYKPYPWYRTDTQKWLAGTRGLSLASQGALATIRAMVHERGEPLTESYDRLARQLGAPSSKAIERIIADLLDAKLLVMKDGGLWCLEIATEIEHQRGLSRSARESRSKVGKKTKQNQSDASTNVPRYKSKMGDKDREGDIPSGDIPHSDISSSSLDDNDHNDTDAHPTGASGRDLTAGQTILLDKFGLCKVLRTGKSRGRSGRKIIHARPERGDDVLVPVSADGDCIVSGSRPYDPEIDDSGEIVKWDGEDQADAAAA